MVVVVKELCLVSNNETRSNLHTTAIDARIQGSGQGNIPASRLKVRAHVQEAERLTMQRGCEQQDQPSFSSWFSGEPHLPETDSLSFQDPHVSV